MRLRPRNVRTRLTLWYVLVLGALLLFFAAATATVFFFSLRAELDAKLLQDYETVEGLLAHHSQPEEVAWPRYLEIWSPDGELQHRSTSLAGHALGGAPQPDEGKGPLVPVSARLADGTPVRMITGSHTIQNRVLIIRLAHGEEMLWQELHQLLGGVLFGIPIALAAAGLGGYLLALRALAPVDAMARRAAEISADNLGERLPVENPEDELGQLARVLNQSLERLEAAFQQLRRFTADASHELRTPLTAVRSVGEVALQERRTPDEYREAIGSMLEEVDRLTRLVDTLLLLSRADSAAVPLNRVRLSLEDVAREAASLVEVLAEEKEQTLSVDAGSAPVVSTDRLILRQALVNLLDNAIKYSPVGATVSLRIALRNPQHVVMEVTDQGPGISVQHRSRVFERFYRVDPSRSRESAGAGLGLAIAEWAVKVLGGSIELESEEGRGATFRIVLPSSDPPTRETKE